LELLQKVHLAKFDEAVELHINTVSDGISGQVKLPHGTGKEVKVAIATDAVLVDVEKGKIDFDILIATPDMMPKMAKVARVLGPKGLMPNPKNGTISAKPEEAAKAFQGGQMHYKTEAKMPVMHLVVGRLSFKNDELSENIKTVLSKIGKEKMRKVVLKSSMSPAIRLQV
jgi:large subunit ribosomal protein L1